MAYQRHLGPAHYVLVAGFVQDNEIRKAGVRSSEHSWLHIRKQENIVVGVDKNGCHWSQ